MSDEQQPSKNNNKGRGRSGRGRGRSRGRGGRGNKDNNDNNNNNSNFAGRGPKNFNNSRGGRGPRHVGNERSRPDRIEPKLPMDSSDEEDETDENVVGGKKVRANSINLSPLKADEQIDHITPVGNVTSPDTKIDDTSQRAQHAYCLICYSSKLHTRRTISPCGHDDVCWTCHLQMRYLHNDNKCPVCKTSNDMLIVDVDSDTVHEKDADDGRLVHHKRYEEYSIWGTELPGFTYRDDVGMFFPNNIYESYVIPLLGYGCGLPNCEFSNEDTSLYINEKDVCKEVGDKKKKPNASGREVKKRLTGLKALKAHLRIDHGYALCDLCVDNKRDFVSKLIRYTPQGLKQHQSKGDGALSGFTGHPLCEFCRPLRFYDIVKLHEHLNKEHYKCHVCDKAGKPHQFFKDYTRLERHFDREHYLCHDQQCLAARFVVFDNEIDLRAHEASVHGTTRRDGGTKIKLEFRVRRDNDTFEQLQDVPSGEDFQFGLNGEAFVPEALPGENDEEQQRQINEPDISHPAHAARTAELRAQAALVRERDGTNASGSSGRDGGESFPALGMDGSDSAGGGMLVGWTADGARTAGSRPGGLKRTAVGKVTEEEFPSLGPGPSSSANIRRAALGLGKKKKSQPQVGNFSAMASRPSSALSTSRPISNVSYASSLPTSAPDMSGNNFPSLGGGGTTTATSTYARTAPNMKSANNFPSLGGSTSRPNSASSQRSNPYAAAQAHARKLNANKAPGSSASAFPALSSDFPPPPTSSNVKKSKVTNAFAAKKPPPMDNVLQFPPPSSKPSAESLREGKDTIQDLKQLLGSKYKQLKKLTKDFASGTTPPETYINEAASLFEQGLSDKAFWDNIPPLIQGIPNESAVNLAMQHLDSLRAANQMQNMNFNASSQSKRPINYILPTKKKTNSWGTKSGGQKKPEAVKPSGPPPGFCIDESKPSSTAKKNSGAANANGKGRKSKAKKKNNELKNLAFGI